MKRTEVCEKINDFLAQFETYVKVRPHDERGIEIYSDDCFVGWGGCNEKFYMELEKCISVFGFVEPNYNNSGTIFWCWKNDSETEWEN